MSVFASRRKCIEVGGRRFACRPPTVATVDLALEVFGREVWAMGHAYYKGGHTDVAQPVGVISVLCRDARAAEVLATCVEPEGPDAASLMARDAEARVVLACAVAGLCDVRRVVASLNLAESCAEVPETEATTEDSDGPSALDVVVAAVARAYGCSPMNVLDWPYEAYLACVALMQVREAPRDRGVPFMVDGQSIGRPVEA